METNQAKRRFQGIAREEAPLFQPQPPALPALDPQAQAIAAMLAQLPAPDLQTLTAAQWRAGLAAMDPLPPLPGRLAGVEDIQVRGAAGPLAARLYCPLGEGPHPLTVFFHGGGFVGCGIDTHDNICRRLAEQAGTMVASVDYRLAPEHPFPAAADDAVAALRWLHANAQRIGADPARIAVAGDSAGANLAAGAALDAGLALRHQLLLYPVVDAGCDTASHVALAQAPMLSAAMMRWYWRQYLPREQDARDPRASLLLRPALGAAPPATIITAECDPLRDEGEAYALALGRAGVPVNLRRWPGVFHGFASLLGPLDAARRALDDAASQLRLAFAQHTQEHTA